MIKKTLLLAGLILINCILDSCGEGDLRTCFTINISATKNFTLENNTQLAAGASTDANQYAILLDGGAMSEMCMANYSFGGSLKADQPILELVDEVAQVSIKSNADLSSNYPAGSELKELFQPITGDISCLGSTDNRENCVREYTSDTGTITLEGALNNEIGQEFFFGNDSGVQLFALHLEEELIINSHEMTVRIIFESGIELELQTDVVELN